MGWQIKHPVCRLEFVGACFILFAGVAGFICSIAGIDIIPKCRYGESECYFSVKVCPFNAQSPRIGTVALQGEDGCMPMLKTRAVEGSSNWSGEQFALPIFVSVCALLPALFVMIGVLFDKALGLMESGKVFIAVNITMLLMSIRIVDNLTFDCRWWADRHHGNGEECHTGLNLYVAGSVLLISCQIALLALSVLFIEKERWMMINKEETMSLRQFEDGDSI